MMDLVQLHENRKAQTCPPPPLQHRVLAVPLQRKGQAQLWHPSHGDSGEISSSPMDVPHYYKEKKPYLKKITNIQSPQDSGSLLR